MEENANKSLVIARRIQLKFVSELIAAIFLFFFLCAITILFIFINFLILTIIAVLILIIFSFHAYFHLKNIYANNHSDEILITYKNNTFKILSDPDPLYIKKDNITNLDYKLEQSFIFTLHFISLTQYNYGKFYIYFNDGAESIKLTIYNVATPDKVLDKISDILGWNSIDDE